MGLNRSSPVPYGTSAQKVLEEIEELTNPKVKAGKKALSQDQLAAFRELATAAEMEVAAGVYDGDTPVERRAHIRRSANAILTNPDMLHVGVLPHHDRWGDVLATPSLRDLEPGADEADARLAAARLLEAAGRPAEAGEQREAARAFYASAAALGGVRGGGLPPE